MLCPLRGQGDATAVVQLSTSLAASKTIHADGVYDLTGRCVLTGSVTRNALRQLPGGIYIIYRNGERIKVYLEN